jgi:hypothetical protein
MKRLEEMNININTSLLLILHTSSKIHRKARERERNEGIKVWLAKVCGYTHAFGGCKKVC